MSTPAPRRCTRASARLRSAVAAAHDAAVAAAQDAAAAAQKDAERPSPAQPRKRQRRAPAVSGEDAGGASPAARRGRKAKAPAPCPTRDHERELWQQGYRRVAGVDEAGRGPLAGRMTTRMRCASVPAWPACDGTCVWLRRPCRGSSMRGPGACPDRRHGRQQETERGAAGVHLRAADQPPRRAVGHVRLAYLLLPPAGPAWLCCGLALPACPTHIRSNRPFYARLLQQGGGGWRDRRHQHPAGSP